jgi:NAD(P)-dependent dehydrogenase (short-subunit alcohol dehydrogenase family)
MSRPLLGQVALVTGAATGIGAATARALAAAGADVVVNHLDTPDAAEAVAAEVRAAGRRALVHAADVGDEKAVDGLYRAIDETFGRFDILVANAGIARAEDIFETSLESWNAVLRTNLTGVFLTAKQAMIRLRDQGRGGRVVVMGSVVGHQGALKGHVHYAATKAGLHGFAKTLARTGAPFGVTVNAVAPGIVETEMLRGTHGEAGIAALKTRVPLDALANPEDVAAAVLYLACPSGRHVTGAVIDVNGGLLMR